MKNPGPKKLVAIDHELSEHSKIVVINWCLGNTCNYACSYCPEDCHSGTIPWSSYETVVQFCQKTMDHYSATHDQKVYFEFTGGEVSHHPKFLEILEYLKARQAWTGMISNGSKLMAWWEKAKPSLDHVCLSFHPESCKQDHFKRVIQYLNDTVTLHVNVMMLPSMFDECLELAKWVESETENISIAIQPLLVNFSSRMYDYTPEQKDILMNHEFNLKFNRANKTYRGRMVNIYDDGSREETTAPQIIARKQNSWSGWKCWAGLDELVIDLDGRIYRAWCREGGSIGHVTDAEFKFPTSPVTCKTDFCHCVLDVMNRRESPSVYKATEKAPVELGSQLLL